MLQASFSDANRVPAIATIKRRFYRDRYVKMDNVLSAAAARGELPVDVDGSQLIELITAPIYYRFLVTGEPFTHQVSDNGGRLALAAVDAGKCRVRTGH